MNPILRKRLWFLLRLLVSVGLVAWLVLHFDWRQTWMAMTRISLGGLAVLVAGLLLNRVIAFLRFWVLLRSEGIEISLGTVMQVSFLATFVSNFLPTTVGGDIAKVGWLASKGYSAWRMAVWTLFDRFSNMLAVGLLAPFCLLLPGLREVISSRANGWTPDLRFATILFLVLNVVAGLLLGIPGNQAAPLIAEGEQAGDGFFNKLRSFGTKLMARRRTFGLLALISYASILPNLLATWLAARWLGIAVTLAEVSAIYFILYFVTLIPISLNGLGIQEVSTVALYESLGAANPQAAALAILLRFAIWITTLPGAIWLSRGAPAPAGQVSESET